MNDDTRRNFLKKLGTASFMATKGMNRVFVSSLATSVVKDEYVPP
jgi:hypothetical protein